MYLDALIMRLVELKLELELLEQEGRAYIEMPDAGLFHTECHDRKSCGWRKSGAN